MKSFQSKHGEGGSDTQKRTPAPMSDTAGEYNLSCKEVILKLVRQLQGWGDERIKKIVAVLVAEGIKISITTDTWYSYVCGYC